MRLLDNETRNRHSHRVRLGLAITAAFGCGLVLGLVAGFVAGTGGVGPTPAPTAIPAPAAARVATATPAKDPLAACRTQLAVATGLLDAQQQAGPTPVPFPQNLPVAYEPAGFEANARAIATECQNAGVSLQFVDCAEFPCLAWFAVSRDDARDALRSCPYWHDRYPNPAVASANGSIHTDDRGDLRYWSLGERPIGVDDPGGLENSSKSLQQRWADGEAQLMDQWGGRPLTDAERKQADLDFWRKLAAQGDAGAADMLKMLGDTDAPAAQ